MTNGKYKAKGFIGGGVGGDGGATGQTLTPEQIANGPALAEWDVAWINASQRANGNNALAASVMRMPLADVQSTITPAKLTALRSRNLPVLILTGADDLVVKGHNSGMYQSMFGGANVTEETSPGGHCFFIQAPENAVLLGELWPPHRVWSFLGLSKTSLLGLSLNGHLFCICHSLYLLYVQQFR